MQAGNYENLARVQQTFTMQVSLGRLFEGIDLLEKATERHPQLTPLRRMLFDYLVGTEQHPRAAEHYQELIRQRAFDLDLLLTFDASDKRRQEDESLATMAKLNPSDLRPLIGAAKRSFDDARFDDAIEQLNAIVSQHPEFASAQALLGRAMVTAGKLDEMPGWLKSLPVGIQSDADYWIAVGDWASRLGEPVAAVSAYGKAAAMQTDRYEPWARLATALNMAITEESESASELPKLLATVRERTSRLNQRRQAVAELYARSKASPESAIAIARSLQSMGRLWEAEAWVAVASIFPDLSDEDRAGVERARQSILTKMTQQTVWQDSSKLPNWDQLPALGRAELLVRLEATAAAGTVAFSAGPDRRLPTRLGPSRIPALMDQATQRGLHFYGRTAGDLAIPGVRNHEMIGCGGGTIDFDLDGWPDLYFTNAGGKPPLLDSGTNANSMPQGSMGIAMADFNQDGKPDLYVTNYEHEYNTFHAGSTAQLWRDETSRMGLVEPTLPMVGFGTAAIDFDNNGEHELIVSNGHVDQYGDGVRSSPYAQPCQLFQRNDSGTFLSVGNRIESEYFENWHVGRTLCALDANRDGQTDAMVTHQTEPVSLLINETKSVGHWCSFRLVSKSGARNSVGAVVTLKTDKGDFTGYVTSGDGYLTSDERVVRFGLGEIDSPVSVLVQWPTGTNETWAGLAVDQEWLLIEGEAAWQLTDSEIK